MARAVQRPAARRDFIIHYVYLAENAGLDVAKRFRQVLNRPMPNWPKGQAWARPQKGANENMPEFAFGESTNSKNISSPTDHAGEAWALNGSSTLNRTIGGFSNSFASFR